MAEVLQEAGFSVETAKDGLQALARIEANEPEVVVADVEMGVMSGYELCRRVRASGRDSIPFLFCSGRGSPDSRVEGLQAGAGDYLLKPVTGGEPIPQPARQGDPPRQARGAGRGGPPAA